LSLHDGNPYEGIVGVWEEELVVLQLVFVELTVVQVCNRCDPVLFFPSFDLSLFVGLVLDGGGAFDHSVATFNVGSFVFIVAFHNNLDALHVVVTNSHVKRGRRDLHLFIDLEVLVHHVLGQDDVLMGLLAGFFHLELLNLTLDGLGPLLLLFVPDLLGEKTLLERLLHILFLGRGFTLRVAALLQVGIEVLFGLEHHSALDHKRIISVKVFKECFIIVVKKLVFLVTKSGNLALTRVLVEKLVVAVVTK